MAGAWTPSRWSSWNAPWGRRLKLAAGAMVTPRLELVRPLTDAPAGNVWVANHSTLGVQVAVKFHAADTDDQSGQTEESEPAPSPAATERFARQAFVASRLAGPHLVKVIERGVAKGAVPYLASELLEGKSLRRRLSQRGALSLLEAQDVLQQVAGVLSKAHGLGLAHGSLCPDHLLATESSGAPFIKILNYGDVSSAASGGRHSPDRLAYLSPEQLSLGKGCTAESDLWSLSVTLYELLTKFLPFDGATPEELRQAICDGDFAPPSRYRSELPPALDQWFSRALAKDPLSRFATASELALGFAQALVADPAPRLEALPPSREEREERAPLALESAPPVPVTDEADEDSVEDETRVTSPASEREPAPSAPPRRSAPPPPSSRRPPPSSRPLPRFGDISSGDPALADLGEAVMSEAVTHLATPAVTAVPPELEGPLPLLPPAASMTDIADEDDDDEELTQVRDLPPGWTPESLAAVAAGSVPPPPMALVGHPSSRPPPPPRASQPPAAMLRSGPAWSVNAKPAHTLALTAKTGVASRTGVAARLPAAALPAVDPKGVAAQSAQPRPAWASDKTKVLLCALLAGLGMLTTWRFYKSSLQARSVGAEAAPSATAALAPAAYSSERSSAARAKVNRQARIDEASLRVLRTDDLPPAPEEGAEPVAGQLPPMAAAEMAAENLHGIEPIQTPPVIIGPVPSEAASVAPAPRAVSNVPAPKAAPSRAAKAPRRSRAAKSSSKRPTNCTPPYYFDRNNIRRLKLECL